ncbi:hypothetical protein FBUS_02335 [Fasciolopsis buskii]|uniref:Uncharacterized protein n=1 Tax=Fasciolopsis buskii TaxID=27845 RepID=A0A8E0RQT0_9TREM|nr:hypothetical protein FBUS_02335 [Fasciolopsis buski]
MKNIETQIEKVQTHRTTLDYVITQFQRSSSPQCQTLQEALVHLKAMLQTCHWRLERPKRYQMSLILTDVDRQAPVTKQVMLFNEINILCSQIIKMATDLKAIYHRYHSHQILIDEFLGDPIATSPSSLTHIVGNATTATEDSKCLVDIIGDLDRDTMDQCITELQSRKTNDNNARRIGAETDRLLQETRKVFYELVQGCEKCLV